MAAIGGSWRGPGWCSVVDLAAWIAVISGKPFILLSYIRLPDAGILRLPRGGDLERAGGIADGKERPYRCIL
jgi:hypothetical protein